MADENTGQNIQRIGQIKNMPPLLSLVPQEGEWVLPLNCYNKDLREFSEVEMLNGTTANFLNSYKGGLYNQNGARN